MGRHFRFHGKLQLYSDDVRLLCVLFLVGVELVSSFRVIQSPWYTYFWPVLCVCVGLYLTPLCIFLVLTVMVTPNVTGVTLIVPNTAPLPPPEDTLLRASDLPPSHQQAELLRAAKPGQETPPEELLRAGQENRHEDGTRE